MEITLETLICWIIIGMSLALLHSKQQINNKIFYKIKHELNLVVGFWNVDSQMTYDSLHSLITLHIGKFIKQFDKKITFSLAMTSSNFSYQKYHRHHVKS